MPPCSILPLFPLIFLKKQSKKEQQAKIWPSNLSVTSSTLTSLIVDTSSLNTYGNAYGHWVSLFLVLFQVLSWICFYLFIINACFGTNNQSINEATYRHSLHKFIMLNMGGKHVVKVGSFQCGLLEGNIRGKWETWWKVGSFIVGIMLNIGEKREGKMESFIIGTMLNNWMERTGFWQ